MVMSFINYYNNISKIKYLYDYCKYTQLNLINVVAMFFS